MRLTLETAVRPREMYLKLLRALSNRGAETGESPAATYLSILRPKMMTIVSTIVEMASAYLLLQCLHHSWYSQQGGRVVRTDLNQMPSESRIGSRDSRDE